MTTTPTPPPRIIHATIRGVPNQWAAHLPDDADDVEPWRTPGHLGVGRYRWHRDEDIDWSTAVEHTVVPGGAAIVEPTETGYNVASPGELVRHVPETVSDDRLRREIEDGRNAYAVLLRRQAERAKTPSLAQAVEEVLSVAGLVSGPPLLDQSIAVVRAALDAGRLDHLGEQK